MSNPNPHRPVSFPLKAFEHLCICRRPMEHPVHWKLHIPYYAELDPWIELLIANAILNRS